MSIQLKVECKAFGYSDWFTFTTCHVQYLRLRFSVPLFRLQKMRMAGSCDARYGLTIFKMKLFFIQNRRGWGARESVRYSYGCRHLPTEAARKIEIRAVYGLRSHIAGHMQTKHNEGALFTLGKACIRPLFSIRLWNHAQNRPRNQLVQRNYGIFLPKEFTGALRRAFQCTTLPP